MPPGYTQANRLIKIDTPLGGDKMLLLSLTGNEAISTLYSYTAEVMAENSESINFDQLLGQQVCAELVLHGGKSRYFNGIVKDLVRGPRGLTFTSYRMEIVPRVWLLTLQHQSRIFQHVTVPDILKEVLTGLSIALEIQGTFHPRDYCVQYRESDFAFASRLMEEEGIYYFFRHTEDGHTMVLGNTPSSHQDMPERSELIYDEVGGGWRAEERIDTWEKSQTLRTGKVILWDHCFELPHKSLETEKLIQDTVAVGTKNHKLKLGAIDKLEFYEYPGGYAQRFDGISTGGGEQASQLTKIYEDNQRTAEIRMRQEAARTIRIQGTANYGNLLPGYKFELTRHFEDDGSYLLTEHQFFVEQGANFRSSSSEAEENFRLQVNFACMPAALPYAPQRTVPKPVIYGTQTAVVVGPQGDEIFTDKYGRVKVQFFWDRQGKFDASSSCWVRVSSSWAGKQWGMVTIPRIGQEVVVAFEEGDPDQPIIVGSVYNADQMPPHTLPDNKTQSGIKSRSTPQGGSQNLNEIRFEDKKGSEHIFIHGEKDCDFRIKNDYKAEVGHDFHEKVVGNNTSEYGKNFELKVGTDMTIETGADYSLKIGGKAGVQVSGSLGIKADSIRVQTPKLDLMGTGGIKLTSSSGVVIDCSGGILLKCGGNSVAITSGGVFIKGTMVHINSAPGMASAPSVSLISPKAPKAPTAPMMPGTTGATTPPTRSSSSGSGPASSSGPDSSQQHASNSEENKEKKNWVEVQMVDEAGQPVVNEAFEITLPDGKIATGTTDEKGMARVEGIDPGNCQIRWINLDQDAWEPK